MSITRDTQQLRSWSKHEMFNRYLNVEVPKTGYHRTFAVELRVTFCPCRQDAGLVPKPRDGTALAHGIFIVHAGPEAAVLDGYGPSSQCSLQPTFQPCLPLCCPRSRSRILWQEGWGARLQVACGAGLGASSPGEKMIFQTLSDWFRGHISIVSSLSHCQGVYTSYPPSTLNRSYMI